MKKEHQEAVTKAELKAILASWPADFSNRLLVGVNISHNRSLEGSDFRGAVLRDCTFSHCKFDNSDFAGADLGDSVFEHCKMEYCSFDGAQMDDAIFDRCACFGSTGMNGDIRTQPEVVFDGMMGMIRGAVMANAPDWRQFYWDLCEPDDENYAQRLWEAQKAFHEIDGAYPGMGAEIFNSGFHFLPEELVNAAGFIAQGGSVEGAHRLAADCALYGFGPLPDNETFVLPHSQVQQDIIAEREFFSQIRRIQGADFSKLHDWRGLARDLGEGSRAGYRQQLRAIGEAFEQIEQRYPGTAALMFNCEAAYLPGEMLPAAKWISSGGSAEEALTMARNGEFISANIDEALNGPTMEM